MRTNIVPGALFPDHELRDHKNKPQMLSELQGDEPFRAGRIVEVVS